MGNHKRPSRGGHKNMGNRRRPNGGGKIYWERLIWIVTFAQMPMAAVFVFREMFVLHEPLKESLSQTEVCIYNDIANDTIVVNCGFSGERLLGYGEHFRWRFTRSISGKTKWSCGFEWGGKVKEFDVWVYRGLSDTMPIRPCMHTPCVWTVGRKDFYRNSGHGRKGFYRNSGHGRKGFYRNSGHGHGDPILQHEWA